MAVAAPQAATYADELFLKLERGILSPRWREDAVTKDLAKWIAFHENDKDTLAMMRGWDLKRPYKVDPMPSRVSGAFADFLYGEDPTVTPPGQDTGNESPDLPFYEALIEENDFFQTLWDYVDMMSAEGETYFRIYTDETQSDHPIIDIHSRSMTVPLFRGRHLVAAAFISVVNPDDENGTWRYVEVHEENRVHNRLYYSPNPDRDSDLAVRMGIGVEQPLTLSIETENLQPVWFHGLPMLAGRIPNKLGRDKRFGISDYHGIQDFLLDLNEAHTIDAENFKLAGKKRAVMPERYAKTDENTGEKTMDSGEEILFTKEGWSEMEDGTGDVFKILEYQYDGQGSALRKEDLVTSALTRVGLTRHFVATNANEGAAGESGTALKARFIPTTLAARGKSRRTDGVAPYILHLASLVDGLPVNNGGFDRTYATPGDLPKVERGTILPEDEVELYTRVGLAVAQGVMSLDEALKELHPRWSEQQRKDEAKAINEGMQPPALPPNDPNNPNNLDGPPVPPGPGDVPPPPPGGGA